MNQALIVEDEQLIALSLKSDLQQQGFDLVRHAATFDDALTEFRRHRFDLVILDINLGGPLDGIDLGAMIRQQSPVPILYLTAYSDPETVARAAGTNPTAFLCKPVHPAQLQASLTASRLAPTPQMESPVRELAVDVVDRLTSLDSRLQTFIGELEQRIRHNSLNSLWGERFMRELKAEQDQTSHSHFLMRRLMGLLYSRREQNPSHPMPVAELLTPLVRMTLGDRPFSLVGSTHDFFGDSITLVMLIAELLEIADQIGDPAQEMVINLTCIGSRIGLSLLMKKPSGLDRFLDGRRSSELVKQRIRTQMSIAQALARSLDSEVSFIDETEYCFLSLTLSERCSRVPRQSPQLPND